MQASHGFELIQEQNIPEINSLARLYRHEKTGALFLSLINDDENKSFGITFRTPVSDSTGVAHILEHSVLCGSRKYPVKEPFIELAKSSLNTFLNAFTYPDKTCYPVASQNLQDFYNLIDVYLDTVFHPRLLRQTFEQEGWHYELESKEGELVYRGVVFNEMKGAYASPENALADAVQASLFPDTIYRFDSGGNPEHIPDLTYEQLRAFHARYYHPSNSLTVMYGDDPPEERLRLLNAYFSEFERQEPAPEVPLQPRFSAPRRVVERYAIGPETADEPNRSMLTVNWLLTETTDMPTVFALMMLDEVLLGTTASPLYKALTDSGLGEEVIGWMDRNLRQATFSVGLKGIRSVDADKVEQLILCTLERLADEGIDKGTVEAAFNTVEFALRENNTGSFPRGLAMMLRALTVWLYGGDPIAALAFEQPLAELREKVAEGGFFEGLIRQYLLSNPHRTTVLLEPDPELDRKREEKERARLRHTLAQMSDAEKEQVIANTQRLKEFQTTPDPPEALATIPTLHLEDLERHTKAVPIEVLESRGVPVFYHDLFTNGVLYFDIGFDLHTLPQELLPYLGLFGRALLETGTEKENFVRLTQRIGQKTGGIYQTLLLSSRRNDTRSAAWFILRGKATPANASELLAILQDVLLTARLDDRERILQMALEEKAQLESRLAPAGSGFIVRRLRAQFSEADMVSELVGGISYLFFLRWLLSAIEMEWQTIRENFERIRSLLLQRDAMIANVTVDETHWLQFQPQLEAFLASLPEGSKERAQWKPVFTPHNEGFTIPGQVNHVGMAFNLYAAGYEEHGSVLPIQNYLNTTYLWERIRMEGGAYGAGCGLDRLSGIFAFSSYRDPNLLQTLNHFEGAIRFLREAEISDMERERAIIGAIGDLDAYQLPDAKGYSSMVRQLVGITEEDRQRFREEVLSTTAADFRRFGEALAEASRNSVVGVVGPKERIEAANAEKPGLFEIVPVL
jgi:Zn-dependent M16 (insulinase) family peptidase